MTKKERPARTETLTDVLGASVAGSTKSLLEPLGIHAVVQDAQRTGLDPESVTLITSSGVLEYIPRVSIPKVFKELARITTPGAVMVHSINLTDQYSYFDSTISPFNYLKYSEAMRKRFDSPLVSKNRLRIAEYRGLVCASGFEIMHEENEFGTSFDKVRVAPEFRRFSRADLLVLHSWLIARRVSAT